MLFLNVVLEFDYPIDIIMKPLIHGTKLKTNFV